MKFSLAIDMYVRDQYADGRFNSAHTERAYRVTLYAHCDDVGDRDPSKPGRGDVKKTLDRWPNPNTRSQKHAILKAFYDWAVEEDIRKDNPARAVRRPKTRAPQVFRPSLDEVVRIMDACRRPKEQWAIHLGVLAGLRSQELRGLRARHLRREGWVWVPGEIAKGGKERWVPVLPELEPFVDEILLTVARDEYVIAPRRRAHLSRDDEWVDRHEKQMSPSSLYKLVQAVGVRADLPAPITPHSLRHAFGDHVARYAGLKAAQALMGHASAATTADSYTNRASLEELSVSVHGFTYRRQGAAMPTK